MRYAVLNHARVVMTIADTEWGFNPNAPGLTEERGIILIPLDPANENHGAARPHFVHDKDSGRFHLPPLAEDLRAHMHEQADAHRRAIESGAEYRSEEGAMTPEEFLTEIEKARAECEAHHRTIRSAKTYYDLPAVFRYDGGRSG
jgi:hypothetical protein